MPRFVKAFLQLALFSPFHSATDYDKYDTHRYQRKCQYNEHIGKMPVMKNLGMPRRQSFNKVINWGHETETSFTSDKPMQSVF
jgi:hypothetical protein